MPFSIKKFSSELISNLDLKVKLADEQNNRTKI